MRYYFDTEFIERGALYPITLISIGIVAEDGREFYAESSEFNREDCNPWVQANVLPHLRFGGVTRREIADAVRAFVGDDPKHEFWAYYADYDWVVFCQLFGTMIDLPHGWPMFCLDLIQEVKRLGLPREALPPDPTDEHYALADARWVRDAVRVVEDASA